MIKLIHIYLLRGGLGNQLFIYSHYLKSLKLGVKARIEDNIGFDTDYRYKRKNMLKTLDLPYFRFRFRFSFLWRILLRFLDNKMILWFDTRYHQKTSNLDYLRDKFSTYILKERIVIHIRLADYEDQKLCEKDYIRMLSIIQDNTKPVYILSDRSSEVQESMKTLLLSSTIMNLNEFDSFKFIAESSDVIISDSSFSLSASYLGPKKKIYYQKLTNIEIDSKANHQIIKL